MHIPGKIHVDRKRVREALLPTEQGPIIRSRLQNDFYCYTMGQFAAILYPAVEVTYGFTNRTTSVRLVDEVKEEDVRRELDLAQGLLYKDDEISFLASIRNGFNVMFYEEYLKRLKNSTLPDYNLCVTADRQYSIMPKSQWCNAIDWEMYILAIISALRTEALMKQKSRAEQDDVVEYTARKIEEKVRVLQQHPKVIFSDFGTRRAGSPLLQKLIVETMLEHLPKSQFVGTSNVLFAKELQTMPVGTDAHQRTSVLAALAENDDTLRASPINTMYEWWEMYGWGLSVLLPDTFGTDWMFENLPQGFAVKWKGARQDSMDPIEFGEKQIKWYERFSVDPREKLMIPSDGLTLDRMMKIAYHFMDRIKVSSGWGTTLTNDTGLGHLSMVVKALWANGRPCVKLSDNLAKAISPSKREIERYKRVFGYTVSNNIACVV
jgi:nicotinate phosphoribosyltransferase